jgi:iron complex outermembrane receptor protein
VAQPAKPTPPPAVPIPSVAQTPAIPSAPPAIPVQAAPGVPAQSAGQTVSSIDRERVAETRAFSVGDVLQEVPGISVKQGNGPRDFGVSIRGSNARNGFGVRNIKVYEDGFPVTQPDGLSRTDLTDPHAYGGIDVWRGPSSALFGNYATGGAINFRTRPGGEINGVEYGIDVGSFGYLNNYLALGARSGAFEYMLFASDVRGDGHLDWNGFETETVNFLGTWRPSPDDKVTVKVIHNHLDTDLSIRLSLNQFYQNPFQKGCQVAATAAAGCGTVSLFLNGFNGTRVNQTAAQAGLGRDDFRTIVGTRWEHKFDDATAWQVEYVVDDRDISQPTGATSAVGDFVSHAISTHLAQDYSLFGMKARHLVGAFYNYLPNDSDTINLKPGGSATLGSRTQNVLGYTSGMGALLREEVSPSRHWLLAFGAGVEQTAVHGISTAFGYTGSVDGSPTSTSKVFADREFTNRAYEASIAFRPDEHWQWRGRVGTGYGTPQIGNLFVTPAGVAGNNTSLESQQNIGYDIGVDWTPAKWLTLSVTGYYEFFENELVSQSAGAGLQSFTFNAPASAHRGLEVFADWKPLPGWRATLAYALTDQVFTDFSERLSAGAKTALLDRSGNKIPGVAPNEVLARVGYDQPSGLLKGLGIYAEYQWKDDFFMDNGNMLKAPGYDLVNVNLHYVMHPALFQVSSMSAFLEVRNIFDKTYIASANNIANSLNATTGLENGADVLANSTGSIYAGTPRTFYGGLKIKF